MFAVSYTVHSRYLESENLNHHIINGYLLASIKNETQLYQFSDIVRDREKFEIEGVRDSNVYTLGEEILAGRKFGGNKIWRNWREFNLADAKKC